MLFRKLHLDWRYGLSELLIVITGVLIALAAEGWRQNLRDRATEREYVQRLKQDIALDTLTLAVMMEHSRARADFASLVVNVMDTGGRDVPPVELVRAIEYPAWFAYPSYTRTTIQELESVGNLRLLRNAQSKLTILQYYETIEWHEQFRDVWIAIRSGMNRVASSVLPRESRAALFNEAYAQSCGPTVTCEIAIPWEPTRLEVNDSEAQVIRERLLAHSGARSSYAEMGHIHAIHYANLANIRALANEALAALEEYDVERF